MNYTTVIMAILTIGAGICTGMNSTCRAEDVFIPSHMDVAVGINDTTYSIEEIITEMKNGDLRRTNRLAEAYRYGRGIEKNMLNAMICYQMVDIDFEAEARATFKENPNDEFARMMTLLNMYDRHYLDEAEQLLSYYTSPTPAWVDMMSKIIGYEGNDINIFILSLVSEDSTTDECFIAFGCSINNQKDPDNGLQFMSLLNILAAKVPFFYNKIAESKLDEYKENPTEGKKLLSEALIDFKKANDSGFLTPENARGIFDDNIQRIIDLESIFTFEELEQLKRLAASISEK